MSPITQMRALSEQISQNSEKLLVRKSCCRVTEESAQAVAEIADGLRVPQIMFLPVFAITVEAELFSTKQAFITVDVAVDHPVQRFGAP